MQIRALALVAALALSPPSAGAQSVPPQDRIVLPGPDLNELIYSVKTLQAQVESLQAQLNRALGDTRLGIYADIAYGGLGEAIINGWAFKCGPTPTPGRGVQAYALDVLVDDLPVPYKHIIRSDRPDVEAYFAGYCGADGMPGKTGFSMVVNLDQYEPRQHAFRVRIKDRRGAVVTSNVVLATIR